MPKETPVPSSAPAEPDSRFPSGPWVGFWLQRSLTGRQYMRGLWLHFSQGIVTGGGSDVVGDFAFAGAYDLKTGQVRMVKQYVGQHAVLYEGRNDDDGLWLWGTWTLALQRGGFHMWPKGVEDPTGPKLKERKDVPVEQPEPVLV